MRPAKATQPDREDYNMEDDSKLGYFFLGVGLGVAVGLLFAPKTGEETRALIKSKAEDTADLLRKRTEDLKESASDLIDRSREAVSRQKEQLNAAVQAGKQAYRETTASGD
jgi:gas vesicle protein